MPPRPYCEVFPPLVGDGWALLSFVPRLPRMLKASSCFVGVGCWGGSTLVAVDGLVVGSLIRFDGCSLWSDGRRREVVNVRQHNGDLEDVREDIQWRAGLDMRLL